MDVIYQLKQDHLHLYSMLHLLEEHLNRGELSLTLVKETLDYIGDYAERYHHPLEDQLMSHLASHNPSMGKLYRQLHEDHQALENQSDELRRILEGIERSDTLTSTELLARLHFWITAQQKHLEYEDRYLLPLAESDLKLFPAEFDWPLPTNLHLIKHYQSIAHDLARPSGMAL
ncbi:hemerythrin domain-containing protein [Pokkaliibacter sp. CJK22405]|uniref:hemerythrin domain-containing protein n=1 Tax=Pokkaliibacter sp. CJK22405 TaxID=3384615 RepID=UPI0039852389